MKAKKSFGQHFLIDNDAVAEIVKNFNALNKTTNALEVGPGMGVLTKLLYESYPNMVGVEADKDMTAYLRKNFIRLNLTEGDFLKEDIKNLMGDQPFGLVGNFPYNISSQIVFKMLENKDLIPVMVGMFQKEMADRIIAPPGSKTYGVISVLTQAYYEGTLLLNLKPSAFDPPPKVDSAVIALIRKPNPPKDYNEALFKEIVKTTFNQRRKMIRNTLKNYLPDHLLQDTFFHKRPETLSLDEFIQLTKTIKEHEP